MERKAGMRQSLNQRTQQQMLMLPRMLQSLDVLQLSTQELTNYIQETFEQNEALAMEDSRDARSYEAPRSSNREATRRHDEFLASQPAPERSLGELVEEQLALAGLEPELDAWVRFLVSCLNEKGYLALEDERLLELAEEAGLSPEAGLLGRAIAALQALEPRGIGGRDAVESMLLQLDPGDEDYSLCCSLLEDFLGDIASNKLPSVAKALHLELPRLEELLGFLRTLNPRPVADLVEEAVPTLHPEVIVELDQGSFVVRVDQSGLPSLSIDRDVRALYKDPRTERELKEYLRTKMDAARGVIQALGQRKETLQRVATAVFIHQRGFLENGPGHLVPLRMNEVADELGIHLSTVSRAVAGVYTQNPWGIHPLRYFFQGAAGRAEGSEAVCAREDVREIVRQVVKGEDPARPFSDDELVEQMAARGFKLARRTLAKYRSELGIPSSYRRRSFS